MEDRLRDLEIAHAHLTTNVEHLAKATERLSISVSSLEAALNRGRGALWGIGGVASVLGGAAALAANKLLGLE